MQKSRLARLERLLMPKPKAHGFIIVMAPGRFCEGWLVTGSRNGVEERLVNGEWVAVPDPTAFATKKETYATEKEAVDAVYRVTSPAKPVILICGELEQKCL